MAQSGTSMPGCQAKRGLLSRNRLVNPAACWLSAAMLRLNGPTPTPMKSTVLVNSLLLH